MSQTKQEIQSILGAAGTMPRHRFGQNFMIDRNLVAAIAAAGDLAAGELCIEVGPGTGTLTEELLASGADVLAVEIDRDLAGQLRQRLGLQSRFRLLEGDALSGKHALHPEVLAAINAARASGQRVKLVANLPYNIASPLIIELLLAGAQRLAFTVQKEVALRLAASENSDDYGPLTVMAQLLAEVRIERHLPPQAFWPQPKIDSSLVVMTSRGPAPGWAPAFGRFVKELFSGRRKMLRKGLVNMGHASGEATLATLQIDPTARPETLSPQRLLALFRALQPQ
jgi:16S rRNA (adenine1518-N6/adenine1519-N6)-dimethyltransferase